MLCWAQLGTDICESEGLISLYCFLECNFCNHLCNGAQNRHGKRMYKPAAVCSYARSWAGRGGKGREGRKGSRKEGCHRFSNSRKVTQPLSVPSESHVFVHSRHYDTSLYINHWYDKKHTSLWLSWQLCQHSFDAVVFIDHNQVLRFSRQKKSIVHCTGANLLTPSTYLSDQMS